MRESVGVEGVVAKRVDSPYRARSALRRLTETQDCGVEVGARADAASAVVSSLELMRERCDSGKDVTRQQAQSELVRVVKNDRVVDCQVKR